MSNTAQLRAKLNSQLIRAIEMQVGDFFFFFEIVV